MKRFLKKHVLLEIFFIFIISLVPLLWFRDNMIIVGHDNIFPLKPDVFLSGRSYTWVEHAFGQSQSLIMGTLAIHIIDSLPYLIGFTLQNTQKIVYIFWFFAIGLSGYILATVINKESSIFKLTGAILYQYNFFLLQAWWIGERTKFSAYIAMALIVAIALKVYKGEIKPFTASVIASIVLFFFNAGGLYGIPLYGGLFISIAAFVLFFGALSLVRKRYAVIKNILTFVVLTSIGFFLVNSYYVIPSFLEFTSQYGTRVEKSGGISGVIGWANEISRNTSYSNLMRLQGIPEWYDNPEHPYAKFFFTHPLLVLLSFLWPILIFFTLFFIKDKKRLELVVFFFIVYLLAILFAAGTHRPLGFLYETLLKIVPGFIIFRTPYYKFASALFLANAFLLALFVDSFKGKAKAAIGISLILITFFYHFPYFTGDIFSWRKDFSTRLTMPTYVFTFGEWLNSQKEGDGRVLMLPPNDHIAEYSRYKWGYLSFQALPTLLSNKPVVINDDKLIPEEKNLLVSLYKALKDKDQSLVFGLASMLHISQILLQKDAIYEENSPLFSTIASYEEFFTANGFEREHSSGEWDVYSLPIANMSKMVRTDLLFYSNSDTGEVDNLIEHQKKTERISDMFIFSNDQNIAENESIKKTPFYVPQCLNCVQANRPTVLFTASTVLPDSPIYQLLLLKEKLEHRSNDPKTAIYNALGLSTKRISEIRQMILLDHPLRVDHVKLYVGLLEEAVDNFAKLETMEDKVKVARDIQYYLKAEREFIDPTLGTNVTGGLKSLYLGQLFDKISYVENTIDPYILKVNDFYNRLYEVEIGESGIFTLVLKKGDLKPFLSDAMRSVKILIDEKETKTVDVDPSLSDDDFISFEEISFSRGRHTILLTYPENPSGRYTLIAEKTDLSTHEKNCFGTSINNYIQTKTYKVQLAYKNDLANDLIISFWKVTEGNNRQLLDLYRLSNSPSELQFEYFSNTFRDSKNIYMSICATNLSQEFVDTQFSLVVNEYISPNLLLTSSKQGQQATIKPVFYKQINPAKYEIYIEDDEAIPIFIFLERYDPGWQLRGSAATHFNVNGYANGWVISDNAKTLTLEYIPQRYFGVGVLISLSVVALGFLYLSYMLYRKRHDID